MPDYRVPLEEISFALSLGEVSEQIDADIMQAVLLEAARFVEAELAPLHASGDKEGCRWQEGEVTTPSGFRDAYRAFCEGGWPALAQKEAYGGQGLPLQLQIAVYEMLTAANLAWALYPTITWGSVTTIEAHGSDAQKAEYLPKMVSGEWAGTMCLTEPHAGSDLGLLRTRAVPQEDGSYSISGTKIFISSGEHDFTDNIIHLTLARLPDAPAGTGGISLFVVPKVLASGERNALVCGGIEKKMGIHGNATCTMNFDGATGYLLGQENRGLMAMFTMINESRVEVCLQAQGQIERAFQASMAYALERRQMRAAPRLDPEQSADPIFGHAEVQRLLLTQRTFSEASRLIAYELAGLLQLSRVASDDLQHRRAEQRLAFFTPIAKGFISEISQEATSHAIQIYGGHGFISETGVEQLYRDTRITAIYEGTTAIQGLDLIDRKLRADGGKQQQYVADELLRICEGEGRQGQLLSEAIRTWNNMSDVLLALDGDHARGRNAAAVDYLMLSGYVIAAAQLLRAASKARGSELQEPKRESADFFITRVLPRVKVHEAAILCEPPDMNIDVSQGDRR